MSERKRKKRFSDVLGFDEEDFLLGGRTGGSRSGYSISVTYDQAGKPVVKVKIYGDVDVQELRKDIEKRYPGARIEGLEKKPLIRIVDEEEKENRDTERVES